MWRWLLLREAGGVGEEGVVLDGISRRVAGVVLSFEEGYVWNGSYLVVGRCV